MRDADPAAPDAQATVYLKDYRAPAFWVDEVHLTFKLSPNATRVISRVAFRPNESAPGPFFLQGEKLKLISASIDGKPVTPEITDKGLRCHAPNEAFIWEAEVEIDPASNTALEGLYMSNGMYCTQCEAEGFRKITYYPDRPDVMAPFTVRVEGPEPVLLSNGNPGKSGDGWAEWHDPWPKPAYLFALVAGDLIAHRDTFTTVSGIEVDLAIYVRSGDEHKCAFGMDALKRSMTWDEQVYGREYDLDVFNIVAVDDFNMGAMENKGLNVFNSSCVLASPETSTDGNYERIEAIIAHEYFHNWTGNRITCRDWFQLCLKEGLTVFRDQQFTGDMRSHPVKRIDDVRSLRGRQFREDNGPLAHPVRPSSFVEINNFYTATVYEKGAEVIGMLKTLVGEEAYAEALEMYFARHDGQACTIEDWLAVFEETTGRDLSQFARWYSQAGTPRLAVSDSFSDGSYTLTLTQSTPATPGQPEKAPFVIPVAIGLLDPDGTEVVPTQVLELTEASQSFTFDGLAHRPVPSLLRGFSAPVILHRDTSREERVFVLAHDTDPFNRWEAAFKLAEATLLEMITKDAAPDPEFIFALGKLLSDDSLDPAYRALALGLPSQDHIAQTLFEAGTTPDPLAIRTAQKSLSEAIAGALHDMLAKAYDANQVDGPYSPDAEPAGKRALANAALGYLNKRDGGARARAQYAAADNMTQQLAALGALLSEGGGAEELAAFYEQWKSDRLVIDKWFALQTSLAAPETAVATTRALTQHPDFDLKNPNRFRAVIAGFAMNQAAFHDASGAGYDLVADWLIKLDPLNPQTTARMTTMFETWRRFDSARQAHVQTALTRILATDGLSGDTTEMITRIKG